MYHQVLHLYHLVEQEEKKMYSSDQRAIFNSYLIHVPGASLYIMDKTITWK